MIVEAEKGICELCKCPFSACLIGLFYLLILIFGHNNTRGLLAFQSLLPHTKTLLLDIFLSWKETILLCLSLWIVGTQTSSCIGGIEKMARRGWGHVTAKI